jgi:amino acid transporter
MSTSATHRTSGQLGTFAGVFIPSILTILGIILFLRLGYVVGAAGLGRALLIIALANSISILTSLSLSAIATNLKVKKGGDYYLISRTLGHGFGGAIGIVLFLAQSVSVAFYCIGFAEVMTELLPAGAATGSQAIAAIAVVFLFVFAWLGADWATRFQYVVLAIMAAALASFIIGGLAKADMAQLLQNWSAPPDGIRFWVLFALFFPAVTGFTQGVSMSGDLRDPGRSLPLGTFLAVGLSFVVYLACAVIFAAAVPREQLLGDYHAMNDVATTDVLIVAGVFAATLSSAMASFLGAPRILQSLASDRLFRFLLPFAKTSGRHGNPRRGVLLTGAIALASIGIGNLNLIAPVVSMFFLISYGLINYATFFETRAASPSFRPRFRFHNLQTSLLGAIACLAMMLAIDPKAGLVAIALLFAVYQYLSRTAPRSRWADGRRSYHLQRVRSHLLAASVESDHPRDWRPVLLLFSKDTHRRAQLLRFASWLEGDSGFATAVKVIEGQGARALKLREEAEAELAADIKKAGVQAFALAVASPSLDAGVHTLVQGFGIGPLRVNTILLNWIEHLPEQGVRAVEVTYGKHLRTAFRLGCNLIVLDGKDREWEALDALAPEDRRIDVWWWGDASSRLMLLLAYLMTRTEAWEDARIRLLGVCCKKDSARTAEELRQILDEVRIPADAEIVVDAGPATVAEHSSDASLVFLPFRLRGNQPIGPFGGPVEAILASLPVVALVLAAQDIDLDTEPEEGKAAELAELLDAYADAGKIAELRGKEAAAAATAVKEKRAALDAQRADETADPAIIEQLSAELDALNEAAATAKRKAERSRTRLAHTRERAREAGALPEEVPEAEQE